MKLEESFEHRAGHRASLHNPPAGRRVESASTDGESLLSRALPVPSEAARPR